MKHIDVRFHFVQEILDKGDIELQKIYTKENPLICLPRLFREWSSHIAKNYSISFQLCELNGARLDELHVAWSHWAWYVGNHNGAANWNRHGAMLYSTQIWKSSLRWRIVKREGKILLIEFFKLCWRLDKDRCNQWCQIREHISHINGGLHRRNKT